MFQKKKGQAALEFLTTYGWAFLVILVMIGALAYFGVLDPTRFIPQRCQFGQELFCERFSLQDGGAGNDIANFELRNNLQDTLYIDLIQYALDSAPDTFIDCGAGAGLGDSVARANNYAGACAMPAGTFAPGEKVRIHYKVIYSQGAGAYDATYAATVFGEVFANVN